MSYLIAHAGYACIAFALAAFIVGLRAARLWYSAGRINPDPCWQKEPVTGLPFEPVDPTLSQMGWTSAILTAMDKSAALNARAAKWTAWAVLLSSVAAVLGALGSI